MNYLRTYISDQTGVAAIEAALMFPFLALTCFGTIDTSLLMLQNHKMETGLTSAGNYLSKTRTPLLYETEAKRLATTGQITAGGTKYMTSWSESDIVLSYKKVPNTDTDDGKSYRGGATIDIIQLTSEYTYEGIGFLKGVSGGTITVSGNYEERLIGSVD